MPRLWFGLDKRADLIINAIKSNNMARFLYVVDLCKKKDIPYADYDIACYCIKYGHTEFLEALLQSGKEVYTPMESPFHLLMYAVLYGNLKHVKLVISTAVVNSSNIQQHSALCIALRVKKYSIISVLLQNPYKWECANKQCHEIYKYYCAINEMNITYSQKSQILNILIPSSVDPEQNYLEWGYKNDDIPNYTPIVIDRIL